MIISRNGRILRRLQKIKKPARAGFSKMIYYVLFRNDFPALLFHDLHPPPDLQQNSDADDPQQRRYHIVIQNDLPGDGEDEHIQNAVGRGVEREHQELDSDDQRKRAAQKIVHPVGRGQRGRIGEEAYDQLDDQIADDCRDDD